jgi:biopolymer transport protein ExbD
MVPLIDVMLVLLVIFIVAAPMLTHSIPLQLPKASAAPTRDEAAHVSVSITADEQVHWDGLPLPRDGWQVRMRDTAALQADTEVRLHADQSVPYRVVAMVLADANRAGLHRIAFVSEPINP